MKIGMVGLGRMGGNMAQRLLQGGHDCVVYDRNPQAVKDLQDRGAQGATSLEDLAGKLESPKPVWVMVPAGGPTESTIAEMAHFLGQGDILIDGGNSNFKDDIRRSKTLAQKQIHYMDVGTSGGVWGLERGYCMMIGGDPAVMEYLTPIFQTLAPGKGTIADTPGRKKDQGTAEQGFLHCGPVGAGHFVKMVHNGIEYGLMQAYAEGFDLFRSIGKDSIPEEYRYQFPLADIAEVWRRGSVVSSWLLDLTAQALAEDPNLDHYAGHVQDSGEGRWTVETAVEAACPADVITAALFRRFRSRQQPCFADQVLSAMRKMFGGHVEPK